MPQTPDPCSPEWFAEAEDLSGRLNSLDITPGDTHRLMRVFPVALRELKHSREVLAQLGLDISKQHQELFILRESFAQFVRDGGAARIRFGKLETQLRERLQAAKQATADAWSQAAAVADGSGADGTAQAIREMAAAIE